jgi:hypothetical protein
MEPALVKSSSLKNIVKKATCFTKIAKATLLDLILTCQECDFKKMCNFGTGISNVHNFIAVQLNCAFSFYK